MFKHQNKNDQKPPMAGEQPLMEGQEPCELAMRDGVDKGKMIEVNQD